MYKKIGFFGLLLLLSACANMPLQAPVSPQISLADFRLLNMGLLEQKYLLRLRLKNQNPFPLPITALNYKLLINEKEFAQGESHQAVTVPASGEEFLEIEVASNLMRIVDEWRDWKTILQRQFNYNLTGGLNITDWAPQLPFEYKGSIPLIWGNSEEKKD